MNIYQLIILLAIAAEFILTLAADILNLKHLSGELPDEFRDIADADTYAKSQAYTRVNTRFGFITTVFDLAVMLTFWFTGGFNRLDLLIRGWHLHPIWNGLLFIGILMAARTLLSLPFTVYHTFVIEERFGFNKTTPATFIKDLIKGLFLSILLGGPLLAGILAFFQYAGPWAWLYCWAVVTLFSLVIQFIAPVWIMPLFNKFTPLEEGSLKEKILAYTERIGYRLSGVFVMDGSRRSSKANAFFTGFGRTRRIALFDTLIEQHSEDELVGVLAHEVGHYKKHHIIQSLIIGIVHSGIIFYLLSLFLDNAGLFRAFYMDYISIYAGLLFFGMLYTPVELLLSLVLNILSRRHEYEADRFAAETAYGPEPLISALKKLAVTNLSNLRPHPFYVFLTYSHPPLLQRIERMRAEAA
ncbi:M48 family metallopeptidase [bacterium]|nr:M48 family metallopeptidase [bacterium]